MMQFTELKVTLHFVCTPEFWRMAILWTVSLIFSYLQLLIGTHFTKRSCHQRCSPSAPTAVPTTKPVCIITGATSGLGTAAAYSLSKEGFFIVLVGRSSYLLAKVMEDIKSRNKHAHITCFEADLSSFQSILSFKASLQQWLLDSDMHSSVQLLINNAGILATSPRLTPEGYDKMMSTNYIGAFSLTKILLPLLENSPVPSRIVNVTSFTHRSVSNMQIDKEAVSGYAFSRLLIYPCARIYEYSKLCLLLFSYELHQQLSVKGKSSHVSVIAADPGAVKTNIMRELPAQISYVSLLVLKLLGLLQSPEDGISSVLDAALAPPDVSGVYFFGGNGRTIESSSLSRDKKVSEKLWTTSCDLFAELVSHDKGSSAVSSA